MSGSVCIEPLALHPEFLPLLRAWFKTAWPEYYGPAGPGNAELVLEAYSGVATLPVGLVAIRDNELCGMAALKAESIATHSHFRPWAGAGLVPSEYRRKGIGGKLLCGVENVAREHGFTKIYCATSTSVSLLERNAWRLLEPVSHEGELVAIYEKAL